MRPPEGSIAVVRNRSPPRVSLIISAVGALCPLEGLSVSHAPGSVEVSMLHACCSAFSRVGMSIVAVLFVVNKNLMVDCRISGKTKVFILICYSCGYEVFC